MSNCFFLLPTPMSLSMSDNSSPMSRSLSPCNFFNTRDDIFRRFCLVNLNGFFLRRNLFVLFFFLSFIFNKFQVIFVQQTNFDVNAQCGRTKCVVFIQHNLTRKKNWKKNLYVKIIDEAKARAHNCGQSHTTNVIQLTEYEWNQLNSQVNVFVCIFYLSIGELFYFEFLLYSYPSPFHIPWQLHNIFTTTESLATATELFDMDFY